MITVGIFTVLLSSMLNACSTIKPNPELPSQATQPQNKHASNKKENNVQTTKGQKASHGRLLAAGNYFAGVIAGS